MRWTDRIQILLVLLLFTLSPAMGEEYFGWDPQTGSSDDQIQLDVTGVRDSTSCTLYNISSNSELASTNLDRGSSWSYETDPGDFIRLNCSEDVAPYLGDHGWAAKVYYPTVNGSFSGQEFVFQAIESNYDGDTRFYAVEDDSSVTLTNLDSGSSSSFTVNSKRFQNRSLKAGDVYEVESDRDIIIENTAGNAFEMAPAAEGGMKGTEFFGTTSNWERGAYAIFSYDKPVQVDVYSLTTSGSSLYSSYTVPEDSRVYENGTGTQEFRFVANDTISVWVGDTESGNAIKQMGDDFSTTRIEPGENKMIGAGRHSPNLVLMGTENNTEVTVDGSTYSINKNDLKKFSTSPPHTYNVSADKPVIAEFMAGNQFNDEGTYLMKAEGAGISVCDSRGSKNECISSEEHKISSQAFQINSIFRSEPSATFKAPDGEANFHVSNKAYLSGSWIGGFNISSRTPVIQAGADFRPKGSRILLDRLK